MAFALLLIYYTERNFVISYDLSNTIHTCFIHEACFYFDKDSFTWYNYLSVLLNLNKEVYSSFANAWLNTNHETISLHSYNWNKSLMFIPVCAVKYLIHVLYKTFFRSPELWKCNILTSLRLLVSNMRKYNFNFFFFHIHRSVHITIRESNHSVMSDQCCLNSMTKQFCLTFWVRFSG